MVLELKGLSVVRVDGVYSLQQRLGENQTRDVAESKHSGVLSSIYGGPQATRGQDGLGLTLRAINLVGKCNSGFSGWRQTGFRCGDPRAAYHWSCFSSWFLI